MEQRENTGDRLRDYLVERRKMLQYQSSIDELDVREFSPGMNDAELKKIREKIDIQLGHQFLYVRRRDMRNPQATWAFLQIGRVPVSAEGIPDAWISDVDVSLVKDTLFLLKDIAFFRKAAIKGWIDLNMTDQEWSDAKKRAEEIREITSAQGTKMKEMEALIQEGARMGALRKSMNVDMKDLAYVEQGEVGYLNAQDGRRYLGTIGAGPCIIVAARNPATKMIGLTHIDAMTDHVATVEQLLDETHGSDVYVLGGDHSSQDALMELKDLFDKRGVRPKYWDCMNSTKSVFFDKETGEVFDVRDAPAYASLSAPAMLSMSSLYSRGLRGMTAAKRSK